MNPRNPAFHRRMAQRRSISHTHLQRIPPAQPRSWLDIIGQWAQIALAIVAIFGYFYTVRPVYQKDRLEEQVAEYEGIIKEQKPKVIALENQLASLSGERDHLNAELTDIDKRLSVARAEKEKIEKQTQFMSFRYRLPDGRPATTQEQVQAAKDFELENLFASRMRSYCRSSSAEETVFPEYSFSDNAKDVEKNEAFPFTRDELKLWAEQGARIPLMRALSCVTRYADWFISKYSNDSRASQLITDLKDEALRNIKVAGEKPWISPFEPVEIVKELASKHTAVKLEMEQEYRKIEEEYGDWESVWGEAPRAIAKHNYEVSRLNAKNKAYSSQINLEWEYREKANALRKSINEEIARLISTATKDKS